MSQGRKHRGYKTQDIVAQYLQANGFPFALSAGAGRAGSDVTGTPGIDWEIKARRGFPVTEALKQATERASEGVMPVAVLRPDGWGPANVHQWPAVLPLAVLVQLLNAAGYGTQTKEGK